MRRQFAHKKKKIGAFICAEGLLNSSHGRGKEYYSVIYKNIYCMLTLYKKYARNSIAECCRGHK